MSRNDVWAPAGISLNSTMVPSSTMPISHERARPVAVLWLATRPEVDIGARSLPARPLRRDIRQMAILQPPKSLNRCERCNERIQSPTLVYTIIRMSIGTWVNSACRRE